MKKIYFLAALLVASVNCFKAEANTTPTPPVPNLEDLANLIVGDAPEGELQTLYRTGQHYVRGTEGALSDDGKLMKVVYAENNTVYFKDLMSSDVVNSWVKGTREDDIITIQLPCVYYSMMGTLNMFFAKMAVNPENQEWEFVNDADDMNLKFKVADDGTISQVNPEEGLGLYYYNTINDNAYTPYWEGFMETNMVFEPFNDTVNQVGDLEFEKYQIYYNVDGTPKSKSIKGVEIDGKVYLKEMSNLFPDAVVVGEINDSQVVFDTQLLGLWEKTETYYYWVGIDQDGNVENPYVCTYDAANKSFVYNGSLAENVGKYDLNAYQIYNNPTVTPLVDTSLIPSPVVITDFTPWKKGTGGTVYYTHNMLSVDGQALNEEDMYIAFYADEDMAWLDPWDYWDLADTFGDFDIQEIPYSYYDGDDFILYLDGSRSAVFYFTGFEKLGLQVIYYGGGERTVSEIAYIYADGTSSLDNVIGNETIATKYYDLTGAEINNPVKGQLYIIRDIKSNGTISAHKAIY